MKIIETRRAPNPRRVRIFLAEKGIDVPFEQISIMELEHKTTAFAALNPVQRVPVLVLDDGRRISESVAICRYFEELQPEPSLMGRDPFTKANVEMWNRRAEFNLFFHITQAFRHTNPKMAELEQPQVPEWGESNRPKIQDGLRLFNSCLGEREFIAGDDYSIADITVQVAVDFMKVANVELGPEHAHLRRWHDAVSARPSASA